MNDAIEDHCWGRRSALMYKVRLTILYHLYRERFFDRLDKAITITTALFATYAVGSLIGTEGAFAQTAALITAILSLVPLVLNPAGLAKRHGQIAADFRTLRADFERAGEHWSVTVCDEMAARTVELEAQEPAPLCALIAHCQNQLNIGSDGRIVHLTWLQKQLMHIVSFDAAKLDSQKPRGKTKPAQGPAG